MPLRLPLILLAAASALSAARGDDPKPFVAAYCTDCHDTTAKAGRLDATALAFDPADPANARTWVRVRDRLAADKMPSKTAGQPDRADRDRFLSQLAAGIATAEGKSAAAAGRSTRRRMNRGSTNTPSATYSPPPWLPLREMPPENAVAHGFNTVGEALDVSYSQIARYLQAAEFALNEVAARSPRPPKSSARRFYAWEQTSFTRRMKFSPFNTPPERATLLVLGTAAQPVVRAGQVPMTVGAADPEPRVLEGVGPNGANASLKAPAKLSPKWFIPNLYDVCPGCRSEPVTATQSCPRASCGGSGRSTWRSGRRRTS